MSEPDLPTYLRGHSLSSAELATTRGAALLQLCQATTADGRLSPDELEALRQWLGDAGPAASPAERYLRSIVEKVLADGRITPEECKEVQRALEHILPVTERMAALAARQAVETDEEAAAKAARLAGGQRILGLPAASVARIALVVLSLAALAAAWLVR
jgi:uncharacterized tellurite resistance protein B-like protein